MTTEVSVGQMKEFLRRYDNKQILEAARATYRNLAPQIQRLFKRPPNATQVSGLRNEFLGSKFRDRDPAQVKQFRQALVFALAAGGRLPLVSEWTAAVKRGRKINIFIRSTPSSRLKGINDDPNPVNGIYHLLGNVSEWAVTPTRKTVLMGGSISSGKIGSNLQAPKNGATAGIRIVWDVKE